MAEVDAAVKMPIILDGENDSDPSIEERMRFNEEIFFNSLNFRRETINQFGRIGIIKKATRLMKKWYYSLRKIEEVSTDGIARREIR